MLIDSLTDTDPARRPALPTIKTNPFFWGFDWEAAEQVCAGEDAFLTTASNSDTLGMGDIESGPDGLRVGPHGRLSLCAPGQSAPRHSRAGDVHTDQGDVISASSSRPSTPGAGSRLARIFGFGASSVEVRRQERARAEARTRAKVREFESASANRRRFSMAAMSA